jgi:hypothetical protein
MSSNEVQASRNRLIQLLVKDEVEVPVYDLSSTVLRLEPYKLQLVPKMVILYGR